MQPSKMKPNQRTQFVTDNNGNQVAVLIPIKEYEKILDQIDDINAIKAYQKVKARNNEFIPAQIMFDTLDKKHKLS